jgi:hypothetical protein
MALFEKGNPGGGRPKMPPEEREEWRLLAKLGREKLKERMERPDASDSLIAKATEIANDRAWGKPVQAVEADITERRPIVIDSAYGETSEKN